MAHPKHETFAISLDNPSQEDMEKFSELMAEMQNAQDEAWEKEAKELGISFDAMVDIGYLRTRSRWTQEKENYLIGLAKQGLELPNIMEWSGEDIP